MAVRAFTFMLVRTGRVAEALKEIQFIREVKYAHICTGGYDIVADLCAESVSKLEEAILEKIRQRSQSIENSVTLFAFEHAQASEPNPEDLPILAYVLISCPTASPISIAKEVGKIDGVVEAVPVLGPFDVIAITAVKEFSEFHDVIVKGIHEIPGVGRTETFPTI